MPRVSTTVLCARADCALPRRHRDGCGNMDNLDDNPGACGGCLPAQAADGLILCSLHADQLLEHALAAGRIHTDLALQLRRQGRGEFTSGSRDRSNMPNEAVMDARRHIEDVLTGLLELVVSERGFTPPALHRYWRGAEETPSEHVLLRLADERVGGRSEVAPAKRTASKVEVLAAFVAKNSAWLAAHRNAGEHSQRLYEVTHGKVWSLAYPSRSRDFQEIGTCPLTVAFFAEDGSTAEEICGGRVYWYPEQSSLAYCDTCDQAETIEWWRLQIMGDPEAVIDTVAGAAWLSDKWRRPVMPSQIANWASRGHLARLLDADSRPQKDQRGRQLYQLAELEACATKMLGDPPAMVTRGKLVTA